MKKANPQCLPSLTLVTSVAGSKSNQLVSGCRDQGNVGGGFSLVWESPRTGRSPVAWRWRFVSSCAATTLRLAPWPAAAQSIGGRDSSAGKLGDGATSGGSTSVGDNMGW